MNYPEVCRLKNLVLARAFARYEATDDGLTSTWRHLLPPTKGSADVLPSVLPRRPD